VLVVVLPVQVPQVQPVAPVQMVAAAVEAPRA